MLLSEKKRPPGRGDEKRCFKEGAATKKRRMGNAALRERASPRRKPKAALGKVRRRWKALL